MPETTKSPSKSLTDHLCCIVVAGASCIRCLLQLSACNTLALLGRSFKFSSRYSRYTFLTLFTHLDEELQFRWLQELDCVARRGAALLLTVHCSSQEQWPPDHEFAKRGFYFERGQAWADFLPTFYQHSVHSRAYIERHWSSFFTVLDYLERGLGEQDIVALRKEWD